MPVQGLHDALHGKEKDPPVRVRRVKLDTRSSGRSSGESRIQRLSPWTDSCGTGSAQNPSAVSAICAIARGIGAASGCAGGEQVPRNASLWLS